MTLKIDIPELYAFTLFEKDENGNMSIVPDEIKQVMADGAINALDKHYKKTIPRGVQGFMKKKLVQAPEQKDKVKKEAHIQTTSSSHGGNKQRDNIESASVIETDNK